jgi:hypothetical protein
MAKWGIGTGKFKEQFSLDLLRAGLLGENDYLFSKFVPDPRMQWTDDFDRLYRVVVAPANGTVDVLCLGIDCVDPEAEGIYANTSLLPAWMQERVAVLSLMKVDPPQTRVEGIGMRIDDNTFWILK